MFSKDLFIEFYERVNKSINKLLDHCQNLSEEELNREMEGFGYPTIRLQLHHMIGAEKYWVGVLLGRIDADDDSHLYTSIDSLVAFNNEVSKATIEYLNSCDEQEFTTERTMLTWGNRKKTLKPFNVLMRTQTHVYHHQGQVLAMCRLLGKPGKGLDYPIE